MVLIAGRVSERENLVTLPLKFNSSILSLHAWTSDLFSNWQSSSPPRPHPAPEEFWQQSLLLVCCAADWWIYHAIALMEVHALSTLETVWHQILRQKNNSAVNFLSRYVIKPKDVQEMCRKQYLGAWRYGSVVKEFYCYCRGYEFNSQPKLPEILVPGDLLPFLVLQTLYSEVQTHRHTHN